MPCRPVVFAAGLTLAIGATSALAQESPKSLTCTFEIGTATTYAMAKYRTKRAAKLAFTIGDIDLEAQTAALVTAKGKGALRVVRAVNANHYLEVVAEGFLNMTTIYDKDPKSGLYPAVHSRHFGLFGEPVVGQYYGFCKANP